jgi:hypothetical protein
LGELSTYRYPKTNIRKKTQKGKETQFNIIRKTKKTFKC